MDCAVRWPKLLCAVCSGLCHRDAPPIEVRGRSPRTSINYLHPFASRAESRTPGRSGCPRRHPRTALEPATT